MLLDNKLSIELKTQIDVQQELAARFKARRLDFNLTQEGLAERSGVSLGSLKRFERTGLIALDALLKIALVLRCLGDFDGICASDGPNFATKTLNQMLEAPKIRRKGRIK